MSKATGQGAVANSMSSIAGNAAQKPGGLQSALGGASTGAGIGAQIGGPAGAGYGAAIGAGAGVLSSMFEDGGIARQDAVNREEKQHANFKKKYMKKVQDELLGSSAEKSIETPVYAEDGNVVQANNGLTGSSLNPSMIGSMGTLDGGSFEPLSHNDPVNATMEKPEMLQESAPKRDVVAEAVNDTEMSPVEKPEEKVSDADKKKGAAIGQGISALSKMLGGGQSAPVEYNLEAPVNTVQNIMQRQAPQQFDNPFMKMRPEYRDGGMPMYASDGNGDIVDSGMESYAGDRVDAKINDGEAILNVPQQQRFMDLVRGKISVDELGEDDIIEGVPSDYREELHDRIEGEDESGPSDTKAKGLEKLLEMLGK